MSQHILLAYAFDGKGHGERFTDDTVSEKLAADNRFAWALMLVEFLARKTNLRFGFFAACLQR